MIDLGVLLGYFTDYSGSRFPDFYSPISGLILMSYGTPVVNIDEDLFWICESKETVKDRTNN